MNYRTRELVALREFQHADRYVHAGDTLHCTPIDAEHYLTRSMAREASAPAPEPMPAPAEPAAEAPATPQRRRRSAFAAAPAAAAEPAANDSGSTDSSD